MSPFFFLSELTLKITNSFYEICWSPHICFYFDQVRGLLKKASSQKQSSRHIESLWAAVQHKDLIYFILLKLFIFKIRKLSNCHCIRKIEALVSLSTTTTKESKKILVEKSRSWRPVGVLGSEDQGMGARSTVIPVFELVNHF